MPVATFDQTHIYYEQRGVGPDLFLIGGLSTNHSIWSLMRDQLATSFRVTTFDNRNAGQSTQNHSQYSIETMAADLEILMKHLQVEKAFLIGHSMGGMILQAFAYHYPKRVQAGIIAASSAHVSRAGMMQIETSANLMKAHLPANLIFQTVFPSIYASSFLDIPANIEAEVTRIKRDPHPQYLPGYEAQAKAISEFDYRKKLSQITSPMLIIGGTEDILIPPSHQEYLHQHLAGSHLELIEDCGHMIQREKPEEFLSIAQRFLKEFSKTCSHIY